MSIIGLDHLQIAIPAGAEAEAMAFYCGLLGMVEIPKPPALADRGGVWLTAGKVMLHLGAERDFMPARRATQGCWSTT